MQNYLLFDGLQPIYIQSTQHSLGGYTWSVIYVLGMDWTSVMTTHYARGAVCVDVITWDALMVQYPIHSNANFQSQDVMLLSSLCLFQTNIIMAWNRC